MTPESIIKHIKEKNIKSPRFFIRGYLDARKDKFPELIDDNDHSESYAAGYAEGIKS